MRPRGTIVGVAAVALALAACQPQATRLLLLDETLTQPTELESTARPWDAAGYRVDYRRFYPHLTHADLDRYRVVMILGGRRPTSTTDALTAGDLAILTEWTERGGVVVLGYPPEGSGAFDRWVMNRWLAWTGTGITIGDFAMRSSRPPRGPPLLYAELTTGMRGAGFDPFPAGVNDLLMIEDDGQALARAGGGAFVQGPGLSPELRSNAVAVAATRVDNGLVVVLSRSALAGEQQSDTVAGEAGHSALSGTEAFLQALARWTRRPAEWARIPTSRTRIPLLLMGGPGAVSPRPPRRAPPPGVGEARLVRRPTSPTSKPIPGLPGWITRQGVRALQTDFPPLDPQVSMTARLAAIDSVISLLDIGAFNILVTDAHVAPLADSASRLRWERDALRASWQQVAGRLQATSVRWVPVVLPRELEAPSDTATPPCPLDAALWGRIASGVRVLARFAVSHTELIPAVGIELDETTRPWIPIPFCDAAWQAGLGSLPHDSTLARARLARLAAVPLAARYDSLLESGLLAAYDSGVSRVVRQRAAALAQDVRRQRRDLMLAVVVPHSPADWFTRSLVDGLATPNAPTLVMSPDPRARALLAADGATGGAIILHAIRLDPALLSAGAMGRLAPAVFHEQDGFWLGPGESLFVGPSDSLARLVRRLSKEH